MPEAYIRGNTIKYLRVPDEVIDKVRDDSYNRAGNSALTSSDAQQLMLYWVQEWSQENTRARLAV